MLLWDECCKFPCVHYSLASWRDWGRLRAGRAGWVSGCAVGCCALSCCWDVLVRGGTCGVWSIWTSSMANSLEGGLRDEGVEDRSGEESSITMVTWGLVKIPKRRLILYILCWNEWLSHFPFFLCSLLSLHSKKLHCICFFYSRQLQQRKKLETLRCNTVLQNLVSPAEEFARRKFVNSGIKNRSSF